MYIDSRILGSRGCIATGNGPKNSWGKFPEKKRKHHENNTTFIQYGWKRGAWIAKPPRFQRPPTKKSSNHLLQGLACPGNCTDSPIQCGSVIHTGETGVCIFGQGFNSIRIIYKSLPQMRLWLTSVTKAMLNKTPGLHQWQGHQAIENKRTKTCKTVQFVYVSYLNAWSQPSD